MMTESGMVMASSIQTLPVDTNTKITLNLSDDYLPRAFEKSPEFGAVTRTWFHGNTQ